MKQWKANAYVNLALFIIVFERSCKLSAIVYLTTFLFLNWQFQYIFTVVFAGYLLIFTILMEANKEKLHDEFKDIWKEHDKREKENE
jgi:hypothetical protein